MILSRMELVGAPRWRGAPTSPRVAQRALKISFRRRCTKALLQIRLMPLSNERG